MPRIPIFRLGHQAEEMVPPRLLTFNPVLSLEGLQVGVDNLRHDVHLSPKFVEQMRLHIARFLVRHGDVEGLLATEAQHSLGNIIRPASSPRPQQRVELADLKPLLAEIHVAALNHAKALGSPVLDLLARSAIIKFLRFELDAQFAQILERCRMTLKSHDGLQQYKVLEYGERAAAFHVAKKIILRKAGQALSRTPRDIEQ